MTKAILSILTLSGFASGAVFEITDRLSVVSTAVFSGSVGIGTTQPASRLEVAGGEIQISSSSAACTADNAGAIRWNGVNFLGCDGSIWRRLAYIPPPPAVVSIIPSSGPISGNTAVTISGHEFLPLAAVTIDGVAADSVITVSANQITARTPPGSVSGARDVTVNNAARGFPGRETPVVMVQDIRGVVIPAAQVAAARVTQPAATAVPES